MNNKLLIIATCSLLLLMAGCKKEENGNTPESLAGNEPRPTWTAPEKYDMTSSMTAVISINLTAQYPTSAADFSVKEDDVLAAFVGDNCAGVATLQDGLFFLYIAGTGQETDGNEKVTLRYWSAQYKNLFVAKDAFPYVNDTQEGNISNPFIPTFTVATK